MAYNTIAEIGEFTLGSQNFSFVNGNPCNILTKDNVLMLCDDIHIDSLSVGTIIGYFSNPQTMSPKYRHRFPVVRLSNTNAVSVTVLRIDTDGTLRSSVSMSDYTLCLNGLCIHINDKYYNPQIGNIYNNGTSPLDAR